MSRRKGRVSNELVAASCAAVLTVYAAGYWRTRDAAQRIETQARERRSVRMQPPVASMPVAAMPVAPSSESIAAVAPPTIELVAASVAPAPKPETPAPRATPATAATPVVKEAEAPAKKTPPKVAAADAAPATQLPSLMSVPLDPIPPDPSTTSPPPPGELPEGFEGWRDGTYTGWGQSNHGDIESRVIIEGGRIVDSGVATCATRYPCDVIWSIIYQPVERQSADVDGVSRATESADAYYYGLIEALKQALVAERPADAASTPQ